VRRSHIFVGASAAAVAAAMGIFFVTRTTSTSLTDVGPGKAIDVGAGLSAADRLHAAAALERLRAAYAAHPRDARTTLALADADVLAGRYADAARLYAQRLKQAPRDPAALTGLAMVWHVQGQDAKALVTMRKALVVDPSDQLAHYDLGMLYFSTQMTADAQAEWKAAAGIDPDNEVGREAESFIRLLDGGSPPSGEK
jgi:tetratricopeptide (TPR) repeat protein